MNEIDDSTDPPDSAPNPRKSLNSDPATDTESTRESQPERCDWEAVFQQALPGLRAFLRHRLGPSDIDDCLQVVSIKMLEKGDDVLPAARRSWLYRVAANEAARVWRRRASSDRALQKYAHSDEDSNLPENQLSRSDTSEKVAQAIATLPPDWQMVVRLRIHENQTFQQIADQLGIPLGTALTQMRRALQRLKQVLESEKS